MLSRCTLGKFFTIQSLCVESVCADNEFCIERCSVLCGYSCALHKLLSAKQATIHQRLNHQLFA